VVLCQMGCPLRESCANAWPGHAPCCDTLGEVYSSGGGLYTPALQWIQTTVSHQSTAMNRESWWQSTDHRSCGETLLFTARFMRVSKIGDAHQAGGSAFKTSDRIATAFAFEQWSVPLDPVQAFDFGAPPMSRASTSNAIPGLNRYSPRQGNTSQIPVKAKPMARVDNAA